MDQISSINTLESTTSIGSTITVNMNSHGRNQKAREQTFDTLDLQQLSISTSDHPVEQADWVEVNEQLRRRGLEPIILAHKTAKSQSQGCHVFAEEASVLLRKTILHLLQENEKKQTIIELTNKPKISKSTASSPIKQLFSKEPIYSGEVTRTKWDVSMPIFKKDDGNYRTLLEDKYMNKIESLQKEIDEMRDSLHDFRRETKQISLNIPVAKDTARSATKSQQDTGRSRESHETNPSLMHCFQSEPSIVKKYKKKCAALKSKIHLLKIENSQLNFRVQSIEALSYERRRESNSSVRKAFPKSQKDSRIQNEYRKKLQRIYNVMGTDIHEECVTRIQSMMNENDYSREIEKLLEKVNELVQGERDSSMNILESRMELLTSLMLWKADRDVIKDLYASAKNLGLLLIPWKEIEEAPSTEDATLRDVKIFLQKLSTAVYRGPNEKEDSNLTEEQLRTTVLHFMRLFDVRTSSAVYTRIYDVYVKYFEMVNVFNSLREMLHLRKDCTLHYLVNAVGRLSKAKHLLHVKKLDSVIKQIEDYDKFYCAFYELANDLMGILGVDRLEEVLPVVKVLIKNA